MVKLLFLFLSLFLAPPGPAHAQGDSCIDIRAQLIWLHQVLANHHRRFLLLLQTDQSHPAKEKILVWRKASLAGAHIIATQEIPVLLRLAGLQNCLSAGRIDQIAHEIRDLYELMLYEERRGVR
jgi:hypothetical protein